MGNNNNHPRLVPFTRFVDGEIWDASEAGAQVKRPGKAFFCCGRDNSVIDAVALEGHNINAGRQSSRDHWSKGRDLFGPLFFFGSNRVCMLFHTRTSEVRLEPCDLEYSKLIHNEVSWNSKAVVSRENCPNNDTMKVCLLTPGPKKYPSRYGIFPRLILCTPEYLRF